MRAKLLHGEAFKPFSPCASPFLAFETDSYCVFFKPAYMHSVPASAEDSKGSLLTWVRDNYPSLESAYDSLDPVDPDPARSSAASTEAACARARRELGMLSRLDSETSGLVAFARRPEVFFKALEAQISGRIRKKYWLLVIQAFQQEGLEGSKPRCLSWDTGDPVLAGREFSVESYFRSYGPRGSRVACLGLQTRLEEVRKTKKKLSPILYRSDFHPLGKVRESGDEGLPSLAGCLAWEASISAGFRHQIRAHMAWCGHPIAGDQLYGQASPGQNAESGAIREALLDSSPASPARLFLECHRLELGSPGGGTEIFELAGENSPKR